MQKKDFLNIDLEDYKDLFDNSQEGIYFSTNKGDFIEVNNAFLTLTGYTKEEIFSINSQQLYVEKTDRDIFIKTITENGVIKDFEVQILHKNKSIMTCLITSSTIVNKDGKIIGYKGIIRNITKRKRIEQQLVAEKRKRLFEITEIQEREKKRLARELHDGIGQLIFGTKIQFDALKSKIKTSDSGLKIIDNIDADLKNLIGEIRLLSHRLRPSILDDFGINIALKQLFSQISESKKLQIHAKLFSFPNRIHSMAEIVIYRIVQEALKNAIVHGKSKAIWIDLDIDDTHTNLTIKDNGTGFILKNKEASGLGIKHMEERAETLNGIFNIISNPKEGTTITVKFPNKYVL